MEILFDRFWKMEDKNNKNQQQFWDLRADEFNSRMGSQRTMKEVEEVLKYLKDKGAIDEKGKVLEHWLRARKIHPSFCQRGNMCYRNRYF